MNSRIEHLHLPVIQKLNREVKRKRLRLGEFFKDSDPLKHGECNPSSLKCVFTQLDIHLSPEELDSLYHAYFDQSNNRFMYREFLSEVANAERTEAEEVERAQQKTILHRPSQKPRRSDHDWTHGQVPALIMLQSQVYEKRVDFRTFFHDFDPLRKGFVSTSNLRCVLTQLNFDVTEHEVDELLQNYGTASNGTKNIHYSALCDDVESVLVCKPLEGDPLGCPPIPFDLFAAKEGKKAILADSEQKQLMDIENMIQRRVAQRGLHLLIHFRSYDKYGRLVITGNQFSRVMTTLGFEIRPDDIDLLCKKYCISGSQSRFAYRDFCDTIHSA